MVLGTLGILETEWEHWEYTGDRLGTLGTDWVRVKPADLLRISICSFSFSHLAADVL